MKTVILMRHADAYTADFPGYERENSLSVTGLLQIENIKAEKSDIWNKIDFVLCSSIKRAKQTFQTIYTVIPINTRFMYDDSLYKITPTELLEKIQWTPSIYKTILIIGHNPGLSHFIEEIHPGKNVDIISTCEVVILQSSCKTWQDINYNTLTIQERIKPSIKK